MLHDRAELHVGQVLEFDVGDHGVGRHVMKTGVIAVFGQLAGEQESRSDMLSARAVRSVGNAWYCSSAVPVYGQQVEMREPQVSQELAPFVR